MTDKEPPRRYGCMYKMRCDNEATTFLITDGIPRAVCEWCYHREMRIRDGERLLAERARQAERDKSA